jgi:hypothetical protein
MATQYVKRPCWYIGEGACVDRTWDRKYRYMSKDIRFCCTLNKHKINWPKVRQNVRNKFDLQYRTFVWTCMRRRNQRKEIRVDDSEADITKFKWKMTSKMGLNFECRRRNSRGPYDIGTISNDLNENGRSGCVLTHEINKDFEFKSKRKQQTCVKLMYCTRQPWDRDARRLVWSLYRS